MADEEAGKAPPSWTLNEGKPNDGREARVESISQFAQVCTFIAGFALADLGSADIPSGVLGGIYVTAISVAAGVTTFNAILGILLVVGFQRLKSWDAGHYEKHKTDGGSREDFKNPDGKKSDLDTYTHLFGDPGGSLYCDDFCNKMHNERNAPLHHSMQMFPLAIVSYLVAVCTKVVSAAAGSSLYTQWIAAVILTFVAVPMTWYARKILKLIIA